MNCQDCFYFQARQDEVPWGYDGLAFRCPKTGDCSFKHWTACQYFSPTRQEDSQAAYGLGHEGGGRNHVP